MKPNLEKTPLSVKDILKGQLYNTVIPNKKYISSPDRIKALENAYQKKCDLLP